MRNKFRKIKRCGSGILAALALLLGTVMTVSAADGASPDLSKTGSVILTLTDSDENAVSGGEISIYEVASLYLDDGDMAYAYTDAFADCNVESDVTDSSLANTLAAYVEDNSISGTSVSVGTDGKVSFEGLELGLYLVMQTTASDSYETINPFVVTVPMESDGVWVYDVDASPKVGTVTPVKPDKNIPETTTETTTTSQTQTGSTLPQTGQLNWPIPVLAGCGVAFLLLGRFLNRSDRKRIRHAVW